MNNDIRPDVLDVERLDQVAGQAMAGRMVDLLDVRRRASVRRRRVRARAAGWGVLAAVAALLIGVLTPAGGRLLTQPGPALPASGPAGPGAVPRTVYDVPSWVPVLRDAPMARAALVVATDISVSAWAGSKNISTAPVLVSADGSQYAALPTRVGSAVSLSRDGTKVAWTPRSEGDSTVPTAPAFVSYASTADGRQHRVDIAAGRRATVEETVWSPDGRWIAVRATWSLDDDSGRSGVSVVDTATDRAYKVCDCFGPLGFGDGRLLVAPLDLDLATLNLPPGLRAGLMPTGDSPGGSSMINSPQLQLSGDGRSFVTVVERDRGTDDDGSPNDFSVVRAGAAGEDRTALTPGLGKLRVATPIAWIGPDTVWVAALQADAGAGVWRVSLADGSTQQMVGTVGRGSRPPVRTIVTIAYDVAAGGRSVRAEAPSWHWYQPDHLRSMLADRRGLLIVLVIGALALAVGRRISRSRVSPA